MRYDDLNRVMVIAKAQFLDPRSARPPGPDCVRRYRERNT
jgi:hypothetical protein